MAAQDLELFIWETDETLTEVTPPGDHTTYAFYGNNLQDSGDTLPDGTTAPDPVIYNNGAVVAPADYTITAATGVIVFDVAQGASDVITADYCWKAATTDIEDVSAFEYVQPINIRVESDINGNVQLVESENLTKTWNGEMTFESVGYLVYNLLYHVATTPEIKFAVHKTSYDSSLPVDYIDRLKVVGQITYTPGPAGADCYANVTFPIQQMENV